MQTPERHNIQDRTIDIYIGGPGYGEGILIVIGKTIAIGIDCCSSFVEWRGEDQNFLEKKISELPPDRLMYWVLTHYHYDHFNYLPAVLTRFSGDIKGAVFPYDYNPADMSYLVEQRNEFPDSPSKIHKWQKEYNLLRSILKLAPYNFNVNRFQGVNTWLAIDLILPSGESVPLRLSICSSSSEVYDKHVGLSVDEVRDTLPTAARPHANRASYIVNCRLGNFEGLFLGDAGIERVEQLLQSEIIGEQGIDCLKVGHHGSLDGTDENLLKLCARAAGNAKLQHALIAPYRPKLPDQKTLNLLDEFKYKVHLCKNRREKGGAGSDEISGEDSMITNIDVVEYVGGTDIIKLPLEF